MSLGHSHSHSHHEHHHDHDHDHGHGAQAAPPWRRLLVAALLVLFAVAAACLVQVRSGEAMVITRFGNPARVLLEPGLAWRLPLPFESAIPVDLRLRAPPPAACRTSVPAMACGSSSRPTWPGRSRAMPTTCSVTRAVRNQPDEATRQLRISPGSALETTASALRPG